jgi:uncharacterized SAM-binding protein YcdF (DUF218 family)
VATAIVVLGNGNVTSEGVYRISGGCVQLVGTAESLARDLAADVVVFSGWSPDGGPSEAEQMRDAWRGPGVELVIEPTARTTAENASRTLPLLLERGIDTAVVVCAPLHAARTRFFFRRLFEPRGVATSVRTARVLPSLHALAWELVALTVRGPQLRAAESELARLP